MKVQGLVAMDEPDQREIIGYSIDDPDRKGEWISLVRGISELMDDAVHEILFHGTSIKRLPAILKKGIRATDVGLAIVDGQGDDRGSFWGDVHTAAAYAEDTARVRDSSLPVLVAIRTEELLADCALHPDLATLDFPLKGLTRLSEPGVYDKWARNFRTLSWKDALDDLRAVVATHAIHIPARRLIAVDRIETVMAIIEPGKAGVYRL